MIVGRAVFACPGCGATLLVEVHGEEQTITAPAVTWRCWPVMPEHVCPDPYEPTREGA